ncbi:MAG TPA: hypothetical protein VFP59_16010 [Candidatus Angelobacter sp.]|nr:hypothetical protein [Candidatus Angelobacter sp.]
MSDQLADRLKRLAEQHARGQEAEQDQIDFQKRVNSFISDHARPEYDRLLGLIQNRVKELNPQIGDLPPFVFNVGQQIVEQGNAAAYVIFDKPIINQPNNALLVSFGPHRNAMFFFDDPPAPVRYRLQAAASDAIDRIVWMGDLGELTSEQLADFILEHLTAYYLEHKPGQ